MPRRQIPCEPPPDLPAKPSQFTVEFHVTTFRLGGGVEPGLPDEDTPIRVPSIRGQLRFWWRALYAYKYPDVAELRKAENKYWGSTERSSSIRLFVRSYVGPAQAMIPASKPSDRRPIPEEPAYVLFPAQQDLKRIGKLSNPGARFELEISTADKESESQAQLALFAMANFGGYGGRSRRGCGALYSRQFVPDLVNQPVINVLKYLQKPLLPLGKREPQTDWPGLKNAAILLGPKPLPVKQAWQEVIRLYREFRQDRPQRGGSRPGRNRWPEPDSIRILRNAHSQGHEPLQDTKDFPRAIFGLPIIFHFKDYGEPADQSLEPASGRMASPFILKPLMISPEMAYPMVLRLHSNLLNPASPMSQQMSQLDLKQKEATTLKVAMGARQADEEFLRYVQNHWRTPRLTL